MKVNEMRINGQQIEEAKLNGQVVYRVMPKAKYTITFPNNNTGTFEVCGINGKSNYQQVVANQIYECYIGIDVIIRGREGYRVTALYITDSRGLAGYIQPTGEYKFGDKFNSGHELKANEKYKVALASTTA